MMENDDLSNGYLAGAESKTKANSVRDMEEWLGTFDSQKDTTFIEPVRLEEAPKGRELPKAPPLRRPTDDSLGRIEGERGWAGKIMQNLAEIPGQAVGGLHDAVKNAFGFIDPLANWLNDNVADLRYDTNDVFPTPKTITGSVARKGTEFLAGFIPAMRGLKALGVENKIGQTVAASAIADFVTRDPHEARLADLWNEAGLPKNVLTEYLKSKPDDSGIEARFKNALESAGMGALTEGVMVAARAIRAARAVPGVRQRETEILKAKYGELRGDDFKLIGDPTKPMIETRVRKPSGVPDKVAQGGADTAGIKPDDITGSAGPKLRVEEVDGSFDVVDEGGTALFSVPKNDKDEMLAMYNEVMSNNGEKELTRAEFDKLFEAAPAAKTDAVAVGGKVEAGDFDVYINFARIRSKDDVKSMMGEIADRLKPSIDEARRGKITQAETERMAEDMGMSVPELLARRKGQAFNAEEALAARQLWTATSEKLLEAAKAASAPNAGPLDQFMFRKMLAVHAAVQNEVLGMRAEAGRALASWAIPAGGNIERARAVQQVVDAMGGTDMSKEMAKRLAFMVEAGATPQAIANFAQRGFGATSMDAVKEAWVNGLLSSPKTHAVNIMSNTLVAFQQIYERAAAGAIREFVGGDGVQAGEAAAMAFGMIESVKDAFRFAAKALKTGETGWSLNKVDTPNPHAISSDAFLMSRETGLGRFVDFLGNGIRVPQRLLGAEDEFFRTIGYRMELRAQALRTAKQEGLTGRELAERVQSIINDPPENIMINSADAALYNTFTSEVGWFGRAIMGLRNGGGAMNPAMFVLPFVRTPVNITRYAFERTPFAPLVGQWRADIAAGGARADLALARMSTGTAIMLTAMDFADKGIVSGEGPREQDKDVREALLRQGWQPYSIRVGNKWYSYNRTDPLGMTLGFAASIAESVKKGEIDEDDVDEWQEVAAMTIAAVSQVTISKTYLEGIAKFVEVMSDPKRYSEKYVDDLVASFLPATSVNNAVKNAVDPVQREYGTPMEAIQSRIAFLSKNLPPRRDLWGKEITSESGMGKLYDFLSPVAVRQQIDSPIDKELVRLNQGPSRIQKRSVFDGVNVNMKFFPKVYDDYVRLSGNDLKHPAWGLGAKDYLDAVVTGKHPMSAVYNGMTDESRRAFISGTISEYRKLAQQAILGNPQFRDFSQEVARLKNLQFNAKLPMGAQQ
jgi:hypothetical protein